MFDTIEDPRAYLEALTNARSEVLGLIHNRRHEQQHIHQKVQEWNELGLIDEYEVEAVGEAFQNTDTVLAHVVNSILSKFSK